MKKIITSVLLLFSIPIFSQDILGKWSGIIESGKSGVYLHPGWTEFYSTDSIY